MEANKFKCAVIGASTNPARYSYLAMNKLKAYGYPVVGYGLKAGEVNGMEIIGDKRLEEDIHTVTLYVGPAHIHDWIPLILSLKPKRAIFNPGTEDIDTERTLKDAGIETIQACTLVMLSIGNF
ncbi:MAG: CoA-binding protein [Saprospiraceae bacterium]|jgi:predicted CoA-binding protein|nr:CoA-binding protein [Candidatus Brachybacter algidus]MBK8842192.1 CoA-binding protein [Candidatus Brachybacter algidus]MBL0120834.1 CoA-binding protein [Candidatus Brachybacter algidus]